MNSLTDEDIERIASKITAGGASIAIRDPRVNQIQSWIFAVFGAAIVASVAWGASSINRLNETMARVVERNDLVLQRLNNVEERTTYLERRNAAR